jgi:TPR repeat protein
MFGKCIVPATMALAFAASAADAQSYSAPPAGYAGSYIPVAPRPQSGPPCGHYGTPPCGETRSAIDIPQGASGLQLFDQGQALFAQGRTRDAMVVFQRAAALGNPRAQYALGTAMFQGAGVPQDRAGGVALMRKAAAQGHKVALNRVGEFYAEGLYGLPHDPTRAFQAYRASAQQGWWPAEMNLGIAYEIGEGVTRNRATAIAWLNRAARDGQAGQPQEIAAVLRTAGSRRFSSEKEVTDAAIYYRDLSVPAGPYRATDRSGPSPMQQYWINRMGAPGNTCTASAASGCAQ